MPDYKICPFCKETIALNAAKCPFCKRVLLETFIQTKTFYNPSIKVEQINYKEKTGSRKSNKIKIVSYRKAFLVVTIIVFYVVILVAALSIKKNHSITEKSSSNIKPETPSFNETIPPSVSNKSYNSLETGTTIKQPPYYFNGLGKLEIKNGTDLDAVAKLIDLSKDVAIYTVYIKAQDTYTIKKIPDGRYKLFFSAGQNWDEVSNNFLVMPSYSKFEDIFDYYTKKYIEGDYEHTKVTTWSVTLNPVEGGTAKTDDISEQEFEKY